MSSVAFDKIAPLGKKFVLHDMPLAITLNERVLFFLCLIAVSFDSGKYCKSRLSNRLGSLIAVLLDGVEDGSASYSGNLQEEHMINGIPLGEERRIEGNLDVDVQSFGCFHEAPFEQPTSGIVGSSSVTKDSQTCCTWIYMTEVLLPLLYKDVAGKIRRVMTHTEGHVAGISIDTIKSKFCVSHTASTEQK